MRRSATVLTATGLTLGFATAGFVGVATAGEQLSKQQFLKAGNSICKVANQGIDAVFEQADLGGLDGNTELQTAAAKAAVGSALPILRAALDEIDGLDGPASLEKKVDKLLDQFNAIVDDLEADPQSAVTQDDPFAKPNKVARKLGLKECDQSG
jgi:hypothetical protein